MLRSALLELFSGPEWRVLGLAASAEDALQALPALRPDLVLVDVSLPGMSGLKLVERLCVQRPTLKTLMVSGHSETLYARAALSAGACGFVTKDDPDQLLDAVRTVLNGETFVSERLRAALDDPDELDNE
ncbi:hypothetical protein BH24DEI2_BH24DEI2_09970 [soil metagenome]